MSRFDDALAIQQGACNPSGVARSLVQAIDAARADATAAGTAALCQDPAVRLIVHHLAHLCGVGEIDRDLTVYPRLIRDCKARTEPAAAAA